MRRVLNKPSNLLMLLAVLGQFLTGVSMARAGATAPDVGSWCHPSGQALSLEAEAALADFQAALGFPAHDHSERGEHCPACLLPALAVGPTVLPLPAALPLPLRERAFQLLPSPEAATPPIGGRAPPFIV